MTAPRSGLRAIRGDALTIGIAVGAYGLSFGAIAVSGGLSVAQTMVLSAGMFTGASQFALVGVLAAGGTAVIAVATSVLLGVRNSAYGLRLNQLLRLRGPVTLAAAHLTIDESAAMTLAHGQRDEEAARWAFWWTGASVFVFWNLATVVGALAATAIADPAAWGLDAAVPAGFLALLWPQVRGRRAVAAALGGALAALVLMPVAPAGVPVLGAAAVALVLAVRWPGAAVAGADQP